LDAGYKTKTANICLDVRNTTERPISNFKSTRAETLKMQEGKTRAWKI